MEEAKEAVGLLLPDIHQIYILILHFRFEMLFLHIF